MRKTFFSRLLELAEYNSDLYFITADLGFGVVEDFKNKFPDRFLNVGVSEQAMVGIASGLANAGKKVICYSIAPFSWLRPFEFFRNGALAANAPVMVVGVGPGFDYSHDGISHYCFEDLSLAQSQPNLYISLSTYHKDVIYALDEFVSNPKPTYFRLPRSEPIFKRSKLINELKVNNKSEIMLLSHGLMTDRAKFFLDNYNKNGIKTSIVRLTNLNQSNIDEIVKKSFNYRLLHVIEDHYQFGGTATRLSEEFAKRQLTIKLINDSVRLMPVGEVGNFAFMEKKVFSERNLILQDALNYLKQ